MSSESMPSESKVESSSTVAGSMSRFSSRMFFTVSMVATMLVLLLLEQAVAAIVAAIQHVYHTGVAIGVGEEVMA